MHQRLVFQLYRKFRCLFFLLGGFLQSLLFFLDIKVLFILIAILSAFFGTFFALRQKRVKRLIIYSSIAQVGFFDCPILYFNCGWFFLI